MKTPQLTAYAILIILGMLILFHLSVVAGFVSPDLVWGGRIQTREDLIHMELASICMLLLFALIVLAKIDLIDMAWIKPLAQFGLWMMAVYFLINTTTNLLAKTSLERYLFSPVALSLAALTIRLALVRIPSGTSSE